MQFWFGMWLGYLFALLTRYRRPTIEVTGIEGNVISVKPVPHRCSS